MDINCPLCDEKATSKPVDHGNYFKFGCGFCGEHVISHIAAKRLKNEFAPARQQLALEAMEASSNEIHLNIFQELKDKNPVISVTELSPSEFKALR